jgi:peptidyl-prolyl cis-trans isomerase SurA
MNRNRPAFRPLYPGHQYRPSVRTLCAVVFLACAGLTHAHGPAAAQQIVALVNGEPVTALDVERHSRIIQAFSRKSPSRKEALDELVDQKVKLAQAKRLEIDISEADLTRAMGAMAAQSGRSAADFTAALRQSGIDTAAFRIKLRSDLAWREVLQKMSPGSFQVRDADVVAALVARGEKTTAKAMQYTMRQIVFVVPRGSPDAFRAQRVREAEALRSKFNDCERDLALAREYREVVVKEPVIRISTDLPQRLQELLQKIPDGQMTPPEPTSAGIEVVAVCGRKETVADLSSRREIRNELLSQRVGVNEKEILEKLRRQAIIEYR